MVLALLAGLVLLAPLLLAHNRIAPASWRSDLTTHSLGELAASVPLPGGAIHVAVHHERKGWFVLPYDAGAEALTFRTYDERLFDLLGLGAVEIDCGGTGNAVLLLGAERVLTIRSRCNARRIDLRRLIAAAAPADMEERSFWTWAGAEALRSEIAADPSRHLLSAPPEPDHYPYRRRVRLPLVWGPQAEQDLAGIVARLAPAPAAGTEAAAMRVSLETARLDTAPWPPGEGAEGLLAMSDGGLRSLWPGLAVISPTLVLECSAAAREACAAPDLAPLLLSLAPLRDPALLETARARALPRPPDHPEGPHGDLAPESLADPAPRAEPLEALPFTVRWLAPRAAGG